MFLRCISFFNESAISDIHVAFVYKMNLADPELELIDPTPNIYSLFVHFDELFFWTKLMGRALVRWSKKMYSCAGVCR